VIDRETFRELLQPLVTMRRAKFDVADWTVYYRVLAEIPASLLEAAVIEAARAEQTFMEQPGELLAYAERVRQARLAASPWQPCDDCAALKGFIEITDSEGVKRLQPCACKQRHRAQLEASDIPLRALIGSPKARVDDAIDWHQVPARVDPRALPAPARRVLTDVKTIAREHTMPKAFTPQTDLDGQPLPERRR